MQALTLSSGTNWTWSLLKGKKKKKPICTVRMERPNNTVMFHPLSGLWVKLRCDVSTGGCQFQAPHGGKYRNRGKTRDISKKNLRVCVWWGFLVYFGLGFCLCVCVCACMCGFFPPLPSSAWEWASFSYMCLFQALLLLHTGSHLGVDQAIKHTFINSGLNCLAITSNLVPWHRRAPLSPCAPAARKPAAWHRGGFIQLEAMFNKHNGVEMAKVY